MSATHSGSWLQYAADMAQSTRHVSRKRLYEEMCSDLEQGQNLMMRCEIAGSAQPFYIIVEDFTAFSWLMDRLDDPLDSLVSLRRMVVMLGQEPMP